MSDNLTATPPVGVPDRPKCPPWCSADHSSPDLVRELETGAHLCHHTVFHTSLVDVTVCAETVGLLPDQEVDECAPYVSLNFDYFLSEDNMEPALATAVGSALVVAGVLATQSERTVQR